jgi:catechol 2,3-dioxygenase-like lactoylglutathione lyase family enzyme
MKIKLHEIELNSAKPEVSKEFYGTLLGLPVNVDQDGLKCFGSGLPGLDLDASVHFPGKTSISFLVNDIEAYAAMLREKGLEVDEPEDSHLGMRAFSLEDPDGHHVEIQSPTDKSPNWLKEMIK